MKLSKLGLWKDRNAVDVSLAWKGRATGHQSHSYI